MRWSVCDCRARRFATQRRLGLYETWRKGDLAQMKFGAKETGLGAKSSHRAGSRPRTVALSRPYVSAVTDIVVPSDCTLILPGFMVRLLAVSHHPVAVLLPPSILNPFSSSRFCVAHMSAASVDNSASSCF